MKLEPILSGRETRTVGIMEIVQHEIIFRRPSKVGAARQADLRLNPWI